MEHSRVIQQVEDLGWFDLDLRCFTTLLGQKVNTVATYQPKKLLKKYISTQPNQGPRPAESPCTSKSYSIRETIEIFDSVLAQENWRDQGYDMAWTPPTK